MAIDLGAALLEKDYNAELRSAMEHYRKKGKSQGLLGQLGGYGAQALATALLSGGMSVPAMAIAGGLANTAGTYLGSKLGGSGYGDYEGTFGLDTIDELRSEIDDSVLTSALMSGMTGASSSYGMGLGAGTADTAGKITDEMLDKGVTELAKKNLNPLEFSNLAEESKGMLNLKAADNLTKFEAIAPDGTIQEFTDYDDIWSQLYGGKRDFTGTPWEGYEFQTRIGDNVYDFDFGKGLYDAQWVDYNTLHGTPLRSGSTDTVQKFLRKEDLKSVGLDPNLKHHTMARKDGQFIDYLDPNTSQEDLMSYLLENQKALELPEFTKQASLRGLDAEGNFLVDDPADLGPETLGKRLQDLNVLGWDESGGWGGLFPEGSFGINFQKKPDIMTWDPTLNQGAGGFTSTPAPTQNLDPWQWIQNNPWMAGLGGAGLLISLLNQND